jgi:hypothetical protein
MPLACSRCSHGRIAIVKDHNGAFPAQFQSNTLHGAGALLPIQMPASVEPVKNLSVNCSAGLLTGCTGGFLVP